MIFPQRQGFVLSYNLAAEKKYPIKHSNSFFEFLSKIEYEKVFKQFLRALQEEYVQFEFEDEFHRYYAASFVPIEIKGLSETGDTTYTKW